MMFKLTPWKARSHCDAKNWAQFARRGPFRALFLLTAFVAAYTSWLGQANSEPLPAQVDTALIISIDVSSSVNERRYRLQLEGIAAALEDPSVIESILTGPGGNILVSVVTWADSARLAVPWTLIKGKEDAARLAAKIRAIDQQEGKFTCVAKMMRYVANKVIVRLPTRALKTIVDVSGDGPDNCNSTGLLERSRTDLVTSGTTINGLPILEGRTAEGLDAWYRDNVIGGSSAFIMPANGYDDFARAFRQKFIIEISQLSPTPSDVDGSSENPLLRRIIQR